MYYEHVRKIDQLVQSFYNAHKPTPRSQLKVAAQSYEEFLMAAPVILVDYLHQRLGQDPLLNSCASAQKD